MRIVFLSPVGVIGGAERVLLTLVQALRLTEAEFDFHALVPEEGPLSADLRQADVTVHVLPLPERLRSLGDSGSTLGSTGRQSPLWLRLLGACPDGLRYVRRLRQLLLCVKPQVVHSNGLKMHLLGALARPRGTALLWHMHDFVSLRPAMTRLLRWVSRSADGIIAVSEAVERNARSVFPKTPIHLIRNAVNLEHFTPLGPKADLDSLAGLPHGDANTVRVGLVATYARWKGHDLFLRAAAQVRHPDCRFYVIGGPIYQTSGSQYSRQELKDLAKSLGIAHRVGFVDFQPDPAPAYRALDVVVHASTRPEPFGLTVAEAMACGRCVVVSRAGGAVELFEDGLDAVGFTPDGAESLASTLENLIADPRRRQTLQAHAAQAARRRFAPGDRGRELAQLYRRFMNANSLTSACQENSAKKAQTLLTSPFDCLK